MTTQPVAELERKTIARVMWRLLPLIMCSYFIAYAGHGSGELHLNALFARRRRSGLLSGDDPIFHLLVSIALSSPRDRVFVHGRANLERTRRRSFRSTARTQWSARS